MAKADEAVTYILDRIQIDPDLRHHMLWTQAHALLMEAEAERLGRPIEAVRAERTIDKQPERGKRLPYLLEAEQRIEELERQLAELTKKL